MSITASMIAENPPFFGKNEWTVDIKKLVTKAPKNDQFSTIPKEEEEVKNTTTEQPKEVSVINIKTEVRFAPYVICHKRIGNVDYSYKMEPSYNNTRGRSPQIEMLEDEIFILKHQEEKLKKIIGLRNKRINKLEIMNHTLICFPLLVLLIAYIVMCDGISFN